MTWAAAHHESGHAVAARALGFAVNLVTLEHEGPPGGTASAWTLAARGPDPAPAPGALVQLTRALALRSGMYHISGPVTEARASHRALVVVLEAPPARRDLASVCAELPDVRDRARAIAGARALVRCHWPVIRRVAEALLVERTLDAAALAALLPSELRARGPGVVPSELPAELASRLWEPSA